MDENMHSISHVVCKQLKQAQGEIEGRSGICSSRSPHTLDAHMLLFLCSIHPSAHPSTHPSSSQTQHTSRAVGGASKGVADPFLPPPLSPPTSLSLQGMVAAV